MKKIAISLLTTSLLLGGCTKEFEEINTNPLNPEDYLTYALFRLAFTSASGYPPLTLPNTLTRWSVLQKVRCHP